MKVILKKSCTYFFIEVSSVPVRLMADALFTRISMPPNFLTVSSTEFFTDASSRISTIQGKLLPPASSTIMEMIEVELNNLVQNATI